MVGIDDLPLMDEVSLTVSHRAKDGQPECAYAEGVDDFFLGIGEEREREMVRGFEFGLFCNGVGAHADHGDAFFGKDFIGVPQRASLRGAAAGFRPRKKINKRVGLLFIDVGEVERRSGFGESGKHRRIGADFEGFGVEKRGHGERQDEEQGGTIHMGNYSSFRIFASEPLR